MKILICALLFLFSMNLVHSQDLIESRNGVIDLPAGKTSEYKAMVISTNFNIPILRFNTVSKDSATNNQKGNVSLFNSVGAGINFSWGRISSTTDTSGNIISSELKNQIGFQVGVLFAANSGTNDNANIFAPTFSLTCLNFQIGCGYELGSLPIGQARFFYTIAYGIPISKLIDGGFVIVRPKGFTSKTVKKTLLKLI